MIKIEPNEPKIKCYLDGRREVLEPIEIIYAGCRLTVPIGFICDGSSIPRFFWRLLGSPTTGPNLVAGIVHDFLYKSGIFDRELCDKIFYLLLCHLGKPKWQAWLMYRAVRLFGEKYYEKPDRSK